MAENESSQKKGYSVILDFIKDDGTHVAIDIFCGSPKEVIERIGNIIRENVTTEMFLVNMALSRKTKREHMRKFPEEWL